MKKLKSLFLCAALIISMLAVPSANARAAVSDDIVILYTNDVHCAVDASGTSLGYATVAAYKKAMQSENSYVTLVDCGDAIQGAAIGTLSKGSYIVDIMNQTGYDFAVPGNHEFDYGMDQFLNVIVPAANYKYLCSNFTSLATGETVFDPYTIVSYGDVKVAYIGIDTPEAFSKSTPKYFQDASGNYIYSFCEGNDGQDLYDEVQTNIDAALADGADYIVAIAHLGIDEQSSPWTSKEIIANTTGLDVVLDGHSHSTIDCDGVEDKDGNTVILSSTGTKLAAIGKLTIEQDGTVYTELISDYTESDTDTAEYIASIEAQYADLLNEVVATTDVRLCIIDPATGTRMVRSQETNLGDLCADAYRITSGADISFVNGGGIRVDVEEGEITYNEVINVHPFGNALCVVEATGQEIIDALEMSSRLVGVGENGGFLQVSGLKYTINTAIPSTVVTDDKGMFVEVSGERRVSDVMVLDSDSGEYVPIDLMETYKLASHDYMLKNAGDGINMFTDNVILQDSVMIDNQVLITYIQDYLGGVVSADYSNVYGEGRITIIDDATAAGGTDTEAAGGDTETADAGATDEVPVTGDTSLPYVAAGLVILSAAGIIMAGKKRKQA